MSLQTPPHQNELFYEKLIKSYIDTPRFVERYWLAENNKTPSNVNYADALKKARQKLRKQDTKSAAELINMGKNTEDSSEAYNYFEKALLSEPRNKEALLNKGLIAFDLLKYREALNCFNKLLNNGSRNWKTLKLKGQTLHELGNYRGAIDAYSEALDKNNNDYELRELLRKSEQKL
jgi:tetratricopeptide (TPR) repeat protein